MSEKLLSLIVHGTLGGLAFFSVVTWAVIFIKAIQHARLSRQNARFLAETKDLAGLPSVAELKKQESAFGRVALAGASTWQETEAGHAEVEVRRDVLERTLHKQVQKERRAAEAGLAVLASIGTTSPFVGLFGTVWGIVGALRAISSLGSASLEVVAGPIGEALIATAVGIAVAVPALLGYNYFVRRLKLFGGDLEDFSNAVVNTAIKSSYLVDPAAQGAAAPISRELPARSVSSGGLSEARV
jgi:biopolymer transport protein ExbB